MRSRSLFLYFPCTFFEFPDSCSPPHLKTAGVINPSCTVESRQRGCTTALRIVLHTLRIQVPEYMQTYILIKTCIHESLHSVIYGYTWIYSKALFYLKSPMSDRRAP
ncbi:hypothetical protein GYMLUDRAFT_680912 [Collybiopsis luxurians FD-317 M1]|uniref:Uncharacterized protein n=1 Tax=Collybiopsis luxurians FD-317 M1 TaxID=944289 RepID=A0A0D0B6N0_9AGAR|nr:hypothetical protein GYMLUDRAFT_680912 [Collybiopsis luxurians FD-317 M1]